MKKFFKASLLAVLFVGMSSFGSLDLINSESTLSANQDPDQVGRDCATEAHNMAEHLDRAFPFLTRDTLAEIYMDIYLDCKYEQE